MNRHLAISKWGQPYLGPQRYIYNIQLFVGSITTKETKSHIVDPLCGVSTDDWWILPTKDQYCVKRVRAIAS